MDESMRSAAALPEAEIETGPGAGRRERDSLRHAQAV
jgi:hypothetical protein